VVFISFKMFQLYPLSLLMKRCRDRNDHWGNFPNLECYILQMPDVRACSALRCEYLSQVARMCSELIGIRDPLPGMQYMPWLSSPNRTRVFSPSVGNSISPLMRASIVFSQQQQHMSDELEVQFRSVCCFAISMRNISYSYATALHLAREISRKPDNPISGVFHSC
jgi:hypothetical protein